MDTVKRCLHKPSEADMKDALDTILSGLQKLGGYQKQAGAFRMICCPFPDHDDDSPSCGVVVTRTHPKYKLGFFNCLGCGKKGSWNDMAKVIGAEPIAEWDTKEKSVSDELLEGIEDKLFSADEFSVKNILKIMHCEEAQPWPVEFDWRGFKGSLINRVGGLIIQDNYNEDIAVVFPVSVNRKIRGGVKAVMQKREKQTSYITMKGEWINRYGLFPFDYAQTMISKKEYNFVVLVEGPRDALRLLRNGIPAIAVLGANTIGKVKAMLIESLDVKVYVLTDNDSGGDKLWENLKERLSKARPKRLKLPREKDKNGKLIKMDPFNAPKYVMDNIKEYLREHNNWKVI